MCQSLAVWLAGGGGLGLRSGRRWRGPPSADPQAPAATAFRMRLSPTPHLSRAACALAWRQESPVEASHVVRALQERETAPARSVLAQPVSAPRCLPRNRRTTGPALRAWGNRFLCFRNLRRIDRVPYARRENLLQPAAETRRPGLFSQCPLHR